jgi:hypothetical protein
VASGGENGIGGGVFGSLQISARDDPPSSYGRLRLRAERRLSSSEFVLDDADHAALPSGDEDAVRVRHIVAAIALVDVSRSTVRPVSFRGDSHLPGAYRQPISPADRKLSTFFFPHWDWRCRTGYRSWPYRRMPWFHICNLGYRPALSNSTCWLLPRKRLKPPGQLVR